MPAKKRNKDVLTLAAFCCFHTHLRQALMLRWMVKMLLENGFLGWHLDMPNTEPPVLDAASNDWYQNEVRKAVRHWKKRGLYSKEFKSIATIQLTPKTTLNMIRVAYRRGVRHIKVYPKDVTNNSENGIVNYKDPNFVACLLVAEELGMFVHFHCEHPSYTVEGYAKETRFLYKILKPILIDLPRLKVVIEHISTYRAVQFVKFWHEKRGWIAATITPQHALLTEDDVIGYSRASKCKGHTEHLCKPSLKRRRDRNAIQFAMVSGLPCFFLGTDTAPHLSKSKYCIGCACGVFNTTVAVAVVVSLFEKWGKLNAKAINYFASYAGCDFFGLPRVKQKIMVVREYWMVPLKNHVPYTRDYVVSMSAGCMLPWRLETLTKKKAA